MIGFLINFFKTSVLCVLFNDFLKRNYPDKYNEIIITTSYELIQFYSKSQILYNKFVIKVNSIIESNPQLKKIINDIYKKEIQQNQVYQINDDVIHIKSYKDDIDTYFEPDNNSIYLFSDNEKAIENKCINRVILHSQSFSTNYEVSNIQFMLIEVKINDETYKINLKTDTFNYYIVDNILDLKFFKYFLHNYNICNLSAEKRKELDKIYIKIIDQNVNVKEFEISDDKFITIKKNDYTY